VVIIKLIIQLKEIREMKTNKSDKKEIRTVSLSNLPVVTLTEKEMSAVKGGGLVLSE
jgi:hypothetical protein